MENVDLSENDTGTSSHLDYSCFNGRDLKGDYSEDMVMVNPSLVTGTNIENDHNPEPQTPVTSHSVPVNLMLGDGTVLAQIKVNSDNGGIDLLTLQNLVSNQLLLTQQTEISEGPSSGIAAPGSNITLVSCPSGEGEFASLEASDKAKTDGEKAEMTVQTSTEDQPKKHKGGWPKGRKRKPEKITNAPKPPSNAYRLYTMDRRSQLRQKYPEMSFAEQVRKMGAEWSHEVNSNVKQKYFDLAEADRKRYVEELKLYQESDTYQDYLNKKAKTKPGTIGSSESLKVKEVYDPDILYCNLCDIYFSTNHNKTEHLMGAKHIRNVTKHFEEGIRKAKEKEEHEKGESTQNQETNTPPKDSDAGPLDVENFILEFAHKSHDRDQEVEHLRESIEQAQSVNSQLADEFIEHKNLLSALEQEVATQKTQTAAVTAKLNNLYMLPALYGLATPL